MGWRNVLSFYKEFFVLLLWFLGFIKKYLCSWKHLRFIYVIPLFAYIYKNVIKRWFYSGFIFLTSSRLMNFMMLFGVMNNLMQLNTFRLLGCWTFFHLLAFSKDFFLNIWIIYMDEIKLNFQEKNQRASCESFCLFQKAFIELFKAYIERFFLNINFSLIFSHCF